jgi:hypothetical protein
MDPTDWSVASEAQAQASDVQQGLAPLDFLLGLWEGSGHSYGDPIRGRLQVERIAGGGFVLARDQLLEDGQVSHEDLAIYRWDSPNQCLRVQHYSPPGILADHYVLFDKERIGIRWVSGPLAPRIELWLENAALCVEVFLPGEEEPTQRISYTRLPSETDVPEPSQVEQE